MKVFVSGCFDLFHNGHVAFLEEAASYGDLYVAVGSDATISGLKNKKTVFNQDERLFIVRSLRCVKEAAIAEGSGVLDFESYFLRVVPDILFVNSDGDGDTKKTLCAKYGVKYIVSERIPPHQLPGRSSSSLRTISTIPYRIELAGGWLDQPWVSSIAPGSIVCVSIEPGEFYDRSGLATSTRKKAIEMWGMSIPSGNKEEQAKMLFCYDNPPGTKIISGSQDSIGIVMPGVKKINYNGQYWPHNTETIIDSDIIQWLEQHVVLLPLGPRPDGFDVLSGINITEDEVRRLASETNKVWDAIISMDAVRFGNAITETFLAQARMFPSMRNNLVEAGIEAIAGCSFGYSVSGAGGGGYLVVVTDHQINKAIKFTIRV